MSRGDTFGGLCWSHPERSLASPRVGLQQKPLFGLEMAFSVSRAAQGANSTAEQIDGYSGRRNGNFLDEVCGCWERSLVPVHDVEEHGQHKAVAQQFLGSASFGMLLVVWTLWDQRDLL